MFPLTCRLDESFVCNVTLTTDVGGLQTPLAGFRFVLNAYGLYFPDRLHQSDLGVALAIIRFIHHLVSAVLAKLNEYLKTLPSFHALNIPGFGLDPHGKATASEHGDLFKVLPVALLAAPTACSTFLHPTQGM